MISWEEIRTRYRDNDNPLFLERRIELVVAVAGIIFCIQLVVGFLQIATGYSPNPIRPAADIMDVATKIDSADIPPELLRELVERPLFWKDRKGEAIDLKPKEVAEKPKPKPKPKPKVEEKLVQVKPPAPSKKKMKHVEVLGIFGDSGSGGAILNVLGKEVRLLLGESLDDGWTLSEMEPNRLVFKNGAAQDDRFLRRINPLTCQMNPAKCVGRDPYGRKWVRELTLGGIE